VTICPANFDAYVTSFDKADVLQSLNKGGHYDVRNKTSKTNTRQNTNHPPRFLLTCRRHPRSRAAQKADELPPSHVANPDSEDYTLADRGEKGCLVHHTKIGSACRLSVKMRQEHTQATTEAGRDALGYYHERRDVRDHEGKSLAYVYFEDPAISGEDDDARPGAAHRGQHRQAAGAATQALISSR
jgi:hypothetical protein